MDQEKLHRLLRLGIEKGASDIHFQVGYLPLYRFHGELVELPRHALFGILDAYEGVEQGLYRREEHVARVGIRPVPCWAYVMHKPELRGGRVIPSGRWRSVRRR